jgi:DeoR/GlpR family transcriptional regulator of sugar metabolism
VTAEDTPLIPDQRRELMLRLLGRQPVLSVAQLTEMLGVSHMTVRRDIATLEREGRAFSVPGGVRIASSLRSEPSYTDKSLVEQPEKHAMARRAAELLHDDMTVYLDAGTTLLALVPHLMAHSGLTVVTNDFNAVDALAGAEHVEVIHIGGRLDHENRSSVGSLAAATLHRINVDLALISTSSWDLQKGSTTPSESKVVVKRAALEAAASSALVAGSSKYGRVGMYRVAPLSDFDLVITDDGLSEAAAEGIRDHDVELVLVHPQSRPVEAVARGTRRSPA